MPKITRKDAPTFRPDVERQPSTVLRWKRFSIMSNPALKKTANEMRKARPYLKKTADALNDVKTVLKGIQSVVQLLKQFEQIVKMGVYAFINSLVALLQRYINDYKSTGLYFLDLTTYHWTHSAEGTQVVDKQIQAALQKNHWFDELTDEAKSDKINLFDNGIKKTLAEKNGLAFWSQAALDVWKYMNAFGLYYKRETYDEFIENICSAFMDTRDVPSHALIDVAAGYKEYEKKVKDKSGISSRDNDQQLVLLTTSMLSTIDGLDCGRPDFGPDGRIKGYLCVIVLSDIYQLYKAIVAIETLFGDLFGKAKFRDANITSWTNGFNLADTGNIKTHPIITAQNADAPNFKGITLGFLAKPIFDKIQFFLDELNTLSYNVDTSILDSLNALIQGLIDEVNRLIKIVKYIDEIINIIDAFIQLTNLYVLPFDTNDASVGGTAGVCELLRNADISSLIPNSPTADATAELEVILDEAGTSYDIVLEKQTANNSLLTVLNEQSGQLNILANKVFGCNAALKNKGINPLVDLVAVYPNDDTTKTPIYAVKEVSSQTSLGNLQKEVIWESHYAIKCKVEGKELFISPSIDSGLADDGMEAPNGATDIEKSPMLKEYDWNNSAKAILNNDDCIGTVTVGADGLNVYTGLYKKLNDPAVTTFNKDTYNMAIAQITGVITGINNSNEQDKRAQLVALQHTYAQVRDSYIYDITNLPATSSIDYVQQLIAATNTITSSNAGILQSQATMASASATRDLWMDQYNRDVANNGRGIAAANNVHVYFTVASNSVSAGTSMSIKIGNDTYNIAAPSTNLTTKQEIAAWIVKNISPIKVINTISMTMFTCYVDRDDISIVHIVFLYCGKRDGFTATGFTTTDASFLTNVTTTDLYESIIANCKLIIDNANISYANAQTALSQYRTDLSTATDTQTSLIATIKQYNERYAICATAAGKVLELTDDNLDYIGYKSAIDKSITDRTKAYNIANTEMNTIINDVITKTKFTIGEDVIDNGYTDDNGKQIASLSSDKSLLAILQSMSSTIRSDLSIKKVDLTAPLTTIKGTDIGVLMGAVRALVADNTTAVATATTTKTLLASEYNDIMNMYDYAHKLQKEIKSTLGDNKYLDKNAKNFFVGGLFCYGYPTENYKSVKHNFSSISKQTFNMFNADMEGWCQELDEETAPMIKILAKGNPIVVPDSIYTKLNGHKDSQGCIEYPWIFVRESKWKHLNKGERDSLIEHEETHLRQVGKTSHMAMYDYNYNAHREFRLRMELEAYGCQVRYEMGIGKSTESVLSSYSRVLASDTYGHMCTEAEARTLLINKYRDILYPNGQEVK